MKNPKDILNPIKTRGDFRQLSESAQSERKPDFDSQGPIWELWSILTEYYGSAFVSQYGEEPNATWAYTLRDLTPDDYRRGIELLRERESAFPPNPGEFVQMVGNDNAWERQAHKMFDGKLLESRAHLHPDNIEAGKDALDSLKDLFKGEEVKG